MRPLYIILFSCLASAGMAQKDYSNDVKSAGAIIQALYAVISGGPEEPRDWERFRNLFKPEARLIPTRKSEGGDFTLRALTAEEYVQLFTSRPPSGFFEKELHRSTESYGTVTHAFSTYETREKKDGPVTNRGINSIQLFFDGKRFFVVNVFWCAESMGFPIPEKYAK